MRFRPRFAGINKAHASRVQILGLLLTDVGQSLTRWKPYVYPPSRAEQ